MKQDCVQASRQQMQRELKRVNRQIAVEQKHLSAIEARLAVLAKQRRAAA